MQIDAAGLGGIRDVGAATYGLAAVGIDQEKFFFDPDSRRRVVSA